MIHAHPSTAADVVAIRNLITAEYGLPVVGIEPVVLGLNRTFKVRTVTETYFFRLCRRSGRTLADIEAEAAVTIGLREDAPLRVARAVPTIHGTYVVDVGGLGDGTRRGLLFEQAQGREATTSAADLLQIGNTLARLHAQCQLEGLAPRRRVGAPPRDHEWLRRLGEFAGAPTPTIERIGTRLTRLRRRVAPGGPHGFCHGDFWCGNLRIADGHVTLFDFDDCGVGPQWYDLATMGWWIETSLAPQGCAAVWSVLVRAYFNQADPDPTFAASTTLWVAENEARSARFLVEHCDLAPELWARVAHSLDSVTERACNGQLHILSEGRARREPC
jgi:Ser/Thr protein kinase RdoA (MazF antagonist)